MASNNVSNRDRPGLEPNGQILDPSYELHKAAFHGDVDRVRELLDTVKVDPKSQDMHGNTALHIAVMLGHKGAIDELIKHGSPVKEKNSLGWSALDEAISYGDRSTITLLLKTLRDQITAGIVERRQELIRSLQALEDFHINLKWEFHSWVPFLSRMLPSDVCRIYKKGACIRVDSSIGNFEEMKWSKGDKTFIFNGEDAQSSHTLSMIVLDNEKKLFERKKLLRTDDDHGEIHERINDLMSHPIIYANMSTKPITVTRAMTGWWFFKGPRSEQVGEYNTDVYDITDLILLSRKRREHLTPEQIKELEHLQKKMESGSLEERDFEEREDDIVPSLPPPPPPTITWDQYCHAPSQPEPPRLGRPMNLKVDKKHYKASVWISEECPIKLEKLLDILEVIVPYKHFHKLRQFVKHKLPEGFPVKLEIPVFPTVTAIVTLEQYKTCDTQYSKFLIPRDYQKFEPKEEKSKDSTN